MQHLLDKVATYQPDEIAAIARRRVDVVARIELMGEGIQRVVERTALEARPDYADALNNLGYTLFQAVVNNALNDLLSPDPCCVLNEKLVPVTRLISTPLVMVVHPSVPARSVSTP